MPKDTLWVENNGKGFILIDSGEYISEQNIGLLTAIYKKNPTFYNGKDVDSIVNFIDTTGIEFKPLNQSQFGKQAAFFDKVGFEIQFLIVGLLCYTVYYCIKMLRKKQRNPYINEDSNWEEITKVEDD